VAGVLSAASVAIACGDLVLVVFCWRRRSVLGGLLGAVGIPLVVFAIVSAPTRGAREVLLVIAAIVLAIGIVLYCLGQVLQRLLDEEPEDAL
jgi:anaerobic C4-dicarboxylate transporter